MREVATELEQRGAKVHIETPLEDVAYAIPSCLTLTYKMSSTLFIKSGPSAIVRRP